MISSAMPDRHRIQTIKCCIQCINDVLFESMTEWRRRMVVPMFILHVLAAGGSEGSRTPAVRRGRGLAPSTLALVRPGSCGGRSLRCCCRVLPLSVSRSLTVPLAYVLSRSRWAEARGLVGHGPRRTWRRGGRGRLGKARARLVVKAAGCRGAGAVGACWATERA